MTPAEALAEALRKQRYRGSATWETSAAQVIDQLRARGFDITPIDHIGDTNKMIAAHELSKHS